MHRNTYLNKMLELIGDRTMTIDQMVAEGFCREMNILEYNLINRCESLAAFGYLKKTRVPAPNVKSPHGIRYHPWRNAYSVRK